MKTLNKNYKGRRRNNSSGIWEAVKGELVSPLELQFPRREDDETDTDEDL